MQSSTKLLQVSFNLSLFIRSVRDTTFLMKGSKDELHVGGQFQMSEFIILQLNFKALLKFMSMIIKGHCMCGILNFKTWMCNVLLNWIFNQANTSIKVLSAQKDTKLLCFM